MKNIKNEIEKLLLDFDFDPNSDVFKQEVKNALAAHDFGVRGKQLLKMVEERIETILLGDE